MFINQHAHNHVWSGLRCSACRNPVPGAQEHINEWFLRHREAADFRAQPICQKIFFRKTQINIFFVTKKTETTKQFWFIKTYTSCCTRGRSNPDGGLPLGSRSRQRAGVFFSGGITEVDRRFILGLSDFDESETPIRWNLSENWEFHHL